MQPTIITIRQATPEFPRHSESSVLELKDGSLLLIWQEYLKSEHKGEDNAPSRLSALTSRDGGLTWSDHRVLVTTNPGDVNVYNPNLLRLPDGEILFLYQRYNELKAGVPPKASVYLRRSRDEGKTFVGDEPVYVGKPQSMASGVIKLLSDGRIITPLERQTGNTWADNDHAVVGSQFSDDRGKTWTECKTWCDLPLRGAMEGHIEELRDGRLLIVMRTQLGAVFRSYSTDRGLNWTKPQTTGLVAPESCPELVRIPKTGHLLIVWNNSEYDPAFGSHYGKRSPLTVAVSKDEGETWGKPINIDTDPTWAFSNPGCFFTKSGKAILVYWACRYNTQKWLMDVELVDLKAAIFDVDWLYRLMRCADIYER